MTKQARLEELNHIIELKDDHFFVDNPNKSDIHEYLDWMIDELKAAWQREEKLVDLIKEGIIACDQSDPAYGWAWAEKVEKEAGEKLYFSLT